MIYLIDAIPQFCLQCAGEPLETTSRYAFYAGIVQECQCGVKFEYDPSPRSFKSQVCLPRAGKSGKDAMAVFA